MRNNNTDISIIFILFLSLLFTACEKDEEEDNSGDPSNLKIELVFIDHETGFVQIQASASNANLYQLFIGSMDTPEDANNNGYFEYTFDGQGTYTFNVRAYGSSGKYVRKEKQVIIAYESEDVPLSRGYISPEEYSGYSLLWQDEFNNNQINASVWGYDIGNGNWGWGNNELQYYRAENSMVADSVLTIEARQESFSGQSYTSSRMKTQGKFSFQYGRIDVRALHPEGQGMWPAIWMLGDNFTSVGWPDCGEIDIMEMIGGTESTSHGTAHWENGGQHASAGGSETISGLYNLTESYHVFSLIWDENTLRWLIDGEQYYMLDITGGDMTEFHQPFFIIMNVAVGGEWPGNPDSSTIFPQSMKVDYVRVFQQDK